MRNPADLGAQQIVLIADPDTRVASQWKAVLRNAGVVVLTASDGETALYLANEFRPRLVLLELMLPRLGGIEVLKRLRANPKTATTSVIMTTDLPVELGDFGTDLADELITKSIEPNDVLTIVRTVLA